jgi:glutathione S-transferase
MHALELTVLSLRYSSWSMRPWLALTHAGAVFTTRTVELESFDTTTLAERRALGSVSGLFPVLRIDGTPIHESLAISEYAAEALPEARLWPSEPLERARARAICAEMVGDFSGMRREMTCHLFGRVPGFQPAAATQKDIDRVLEIWTQCLDRSGGPFLFGRVSIADFFYFPVLTRLRTYGIALTPATAPWAGAMNALPAVRELVLKARNEPRIAVYDDYVRSLGGDPDPKSG